MNRIFKVLLGVSILCISLHSHSQVVCKKKYLPNEYRTLSGEELKSYLCTQLQEAELADAYKKKVISMGAGSALRTEASLYVVQCNEIVYDVIVALEKRGIKVADLQSADLPSDCLNLLK